MTHPRVASPWSDQLHEVRDAILSARAAGLKGDLCSAAEWYAGRSVFVTGGSGFMGRVLVEFLLRCFPDIGRVFLLLRPKRGVDPAHRLAALVNVPLFDRLRGEQPEALSKLVPVSGDITALSLGMAEADRQLLCREVSVVFHVAASVRFDDSFQKAVFTNLRSTREVVQLARDMPQLKVLVHVSTAYCNINQDPLCEQVYPTDLDWRLVIRLAERSDSEIVDLLESKVRGFQPNTYVFTKALAEQLMQDAVRDFQLPIVITRPSIVIGSIKDPMPGWMDNLNGLAGFWAGALKGVLRVMYGDPTVTMDGVPVDVATKITLLAAWAKGQGMRLSSGPVDVVNVCVGPLLGLTFSEMSWICNCMADEAPMAGIVRTPHFTVVKSKLVHTAILLYRHIFFAFLLDTLAKLTGVKPRLMVIYRRISEGLHATSPFRIHYNFVMDNQLKLQSMLHPNDKLLNCVEVYSYRDNFNIFKRYNSNGIWGIMKYALKEEDDRDINMKGLVRARWVTWAFDLTCGMLLLGALFMARTLLYTH